MCEVPYTGEFSHCTIIEFDGTAPTLAEERGEEIVLNGEFGPLCSRTIDVGALSKVARALRQPIWSDLEEVLPITLSSGFFDRAAAQAGAILYLGEFGSIGLPQRSDDGWVIPRISAHFQEGWAGCWHFGCGRQLDYLAHGPDLGG